jgi:hypothetical protein
MAGAMVAALMIGRRHEEDLKALLEIEKNQLREFAARIKSLRTDLLSIRDLRQQTGQIAPSNSAIILVRQVLALATLARQKDLTVDELVEALDEAVKNREWARDDNKKWASVSAVLREVLSSEKIKILAKTLDLSHSYDNLLNSVRILTDIRPVFDDARSSIIGGIIAQTIRIEYETEDGDRSLSIVLDADSVRNLREECDRALAKAKEARRLIGEKCGIRTVELHEDTDDVD